MGIPHAFRRQKGQVNIARKEELLERKLRCTNRPLLFAVITYLWIIDDEWRLLPLDAVGPYAWALYEEGTSSSYSYFSPEVQTKPVFNVNALATVWTNKKLTCRKFSLALRRQHATVEVAVDEAGEGQHVHDDRTSTSRESMSLQWMHKGNRAKSSIPKTVGNRTGPADGWRERYNSSTSGRTCQRKTKGGDSSVSACR